MKTFLISLTCLLGVACLGALAGCTRDVSAVYPYNEIIGAKYEFLERCVVAKSTDPSFYTDIFPTSRLEFSKNKSDAELMGSRVESSLKVVDIIPVGSTLEVVAVRFTFTAAVGGWLKRICTIVKPDGTQISVREPHSLVRWRTPNANGTIDFFDEAILRRLDSHDM